jgi:hypothetical protein
MTANKSTMRLKKSRFRGSSYCSPFLVWKNGLWNHWQQYYYLIWLHLRYPLKRETFQMKVYNMRGHLTLSNALSKSILKIPPIFFLQCDWLIDWLSHAKLWLLLWCFPCMNVVWDGLITVSTIMFSIKPNFEDKIKCTSYVHMMT